MAWTKPMPAHPVVAVAGATGAVGREMLKCLEQLDFPASEVRVLASARSAGQKLPFAGCGQSPSRALTSPCSLQALPSPSSSARPSWTPAPS